MIFDLEKWCSDVGSAGADIVFDEVMASDSLSESLAMFDAGQDVLIGRALIRLREEHGFTDRRALDAAGQAILDAFARRVDLRIRARHRGSNVVAFKGAVN